MKMLTFCLTAVVASSGFFIAAAAAIEVQKKMEDVDKTLNSTASGWCLQWIK